MRRALARGFARSVLLFAVTTTLGCDDGDDTDATDSQGDSDDTIDTTPADTLAAAGYEGQATVGGLGDSDPADNTYVGTEALYVVGTTTATEYCRFSWVASGAPLDPASAPLNQCTGCAWGFDVTMSGGTQTAGDCTAYFPGGTDLAAVRGPYGFGFAPSFYDPFYGATYTNVATYYYEADLGSAWYAIPDSSFTESSGAYAYDFPLGYFAP